MNIPIRNNVTKEHIFDVRHGENYSNVKGHYADFRSATLNSIIFFKCDFRGSMWNNTHLKDLLFIECSLKGANFSDSNLEDCSFSHCDVEGATFFGSNLASTVVRESKGEFILVDDRTLLSSDWLVFSIENADNVTRSMIDNNNE